MLRIVDDEGGTAEAVLKCGPASEWREPYTCEAAALELASAHDLAVPRVLGSQLEGPEVALLLSRVGGTTAIPRTASTERLHELGRVAATIHRVARAPDDVLPLRERHTPWLHEALWRRWASRYRAASANAKDDVLRAFVTEHPRGGQSLMTGTVQWSIDGARETLASSESTPLLDEAGERILDVPVPDEPMVFVHGDLWQGNTLWDGDRCTGVIDWEAAGAGHPGVDLGCLRWDAVMFFGPHAADEVLAGWEQASAAAATQVAYWDVVAALNYPADMSGLLSTFRECGRSDLDAPTVTERRDAFVEDALTRL